MLWTMRKLLQSNSRNMSYRFMRVIVMFDLPVTTETNRREYAKFRKFLIKSGFLMMQESVYIRLALNQNAANMICDMLRAHCPSEGVVQVLTITEKQFQKMEFIIGEMSTETVNSDERLLIL